MRYTPTHYATGLLAAWKEKSAQERVAIFRRFLQVLRKNRDWSKLELILREVEKKHLRELGMRKMELASATGVKREIRAKIKKILGNRLTIKEKIKPELLAGMKILLDDEVLIDASAQRQLDLLFRP